MRPFLLALLVLPLASAQWLVSVDANPFSSELFVVASSPGCVYVLNGAVSAVYEFNGSSFVPRGAGQVICSQGDDIFRIVLSPAAYVQLSEAEVVPRSVYFSRVEWKTISGCTFVDITPMPLSVLVAMVVFVGLLVFLLYVRNCSQPRDVESLILEYIAKNPGCTQKDICAATGLEKYRVSRILSRLEQRGKVVRVRRGISKRVYLPEQLQ